MKCALEAEELKKIVEKVRRCRDVCSNTSFFDLPAVLPPKKDLENLMDLVGELLISHRSCENSGLSGHSPKNDQGLFGGKHI